MAPSISKEELMRNNDSVVWNFNGIPSSPKIDTTQRVCEKIWSVLNSRVCNVVIVIFVFAEGIVVLSELLINLGVVQDPEWKLKNTNCTQNLSIMPNEISPKMKKTKDAFSYCSLSILSLFVFEIILRILTGKARFIVQGIEVFDAIIVLIAFGLNVTFFIAPIKQGTGKESALLIILLRLWRINSVIQSIIQASKAKLSNMINAYQKDKIQSDHKVDLLILKVEDLEHEVAYLKEKLKKTEKEPLFVKRRRAKDGSSSSLQKPNSITINIEPNLSNISSPVTETCSLHSHSPVVEVKLKDKVITYAENAAAIIVDEALLIACHALPDGSLYGKIDATHSKASTKLRRRPDGSFESGYGSAAGSINWNRVRENFRTDESKPAVPLSAIRNSLKCPESSPESGYGSAGSANNPCSSSTTSSKDTETESASLSSGNLKQSSSVFLFPESAERAAESCDVQLEVLDEVTEIERVKHVEFNPYEHDSDIPITSL